jgi:hypothetical protein
MVAFVSVSLALWLMTRPLMFWMLLVIWLMVAAV